MLPGTWLKIRILFDVDVEEMIDVLFEEYRNGIVDEKEFVESFEVLNGMVI